jgi:hypothetical protein
MPKSMKRSKSNGLKSRKRPGKKSRNAKKMRKTRKNKGGSMTSVTCKSLAVVGGVIGWAITGFGINPEEVYEMADCDNAKNKAFQSLKEISLAKDIIRFGKTNKSYKYDITENIELDTYRKGFLGNNKKKFNLLHIKKNTGFNVNKDEYYLYDDNKEIDIFRSIAFTYMNRYVSKYFTIRKRKFHILKLLLEINPDDIVTENIEKIKEKINNLDDDDFSNIRKNKELRDEMTKFKEKYIYMFASFKNAAEYVCKNNESLKNTCEGFVLDDSTSQEDKQQIIESVNQLLLIPVAEYEKFAMKDVYPLANKSHF